jgi:exodeoxyribonuclease VII small subunit
MPLSPTPDGDGAPARSFDTAFRELQAVVAQLEAGGLGLEDAVRLFERGSALVTDCQHIVDHAELRVTRLAVESAAPQLDSPAES